MKIKIKSEELPNLYLLIPTSLFCGRLTSWALSKMPQNQACPITGQQVIALAKTLKEFKKHHKHFQLLEVQSADGTQVKITL